MFIHHPEQFVDVFLYLIVYLLIISLVNMV